MTLFINFSTGHGRGAILKPFLSQFANSRIIWPAKLFYELQLHRARYTIHNAPVDSVEVFVRLVGERLCLLIVDIFIIRSDDAEDCDTTAENHLAALKYSQLPVQPELGLGPDNYLSPQVFHHPHGTRPILLRRCQFEEFPLGNQLFNHVLGVLGRHGGSLTSL